MGVVYHALQASLDREVAIKMIYAGQLTSASAFRRFQTEAEAMAKLDHPNIVSIYEVGEHQGQQYLSMKLIEGASLAERMEEFKLPSAEPERAPGVSSSPDSTPPSEVLDGIQAKGGAKTPRSDDPKIESRNRQFKIAALVAKVAQAIHYAHQRGVLHRDLKPSNILVDCRDEPYVTDFGVARLLHQDQRQTQTQAVMGTPSYMSPEQAAGRAKDVTVAADTFSLGAILYELLTGQAPFTGDSDAAIMQQVMAKDPPRPQTLCPQVDRDLETICLKCLEKEPSKRYATAEKLAEELNRYLRGEPIQARPISRAERTWRLCRRHPGIASLTTALILALGIGAAGFIYQSRRVWEAHAKEKLISDYVAKSDFSRALANPQHIYPVSMTIYVLSAEDPTLGGALTEGDLLKMEPGQETILKEAAQTNVVTMRVMTSKGEEGEVAAGTRISVSLKDLQQLDNEFRPKLGQNSPKTRE